MQLKDVHIKVTVDKKGVKPALDQLDHEVKKTSQSIDKMIGSIDFKRAALRLTAFAASVGLVGRHFLSAEKRTETYDTRLKVLLGSADAAAMVFRDMSDYAARVPHTFDQVMESATALAGIMKNGITDIRKWMPLIGDLAAASGLTMQETVGQFIRMYSAGAQAADLFRERGILAMLGFKAGVQYTAEETQKQLIKAWESTTSKFRGATDELAKTFAGKMSMLGDAWFQFRLRVMESGTMDFIKGELDDIITKINNMKLTGEFDKLAKTISDGLVGSLITTKETIETLTPTAKHLAEIMKDAIDGFNSLPPWVKEIGIIAAVFGGKKGVAAGIAAGLAVDFDKQKAQSLSQRYDEWLYSKLDERGIPRSVMGEHYRRKKYSSPFWQSGTSSYVSNMMGPYATTDWMRNGKGPTPSGYQQQANANKQPLYFNSRRGLLPSYMEEPRGYLYHAPQYIDRYSASRIGYNVSLSGKFPGSGLGGGSASPFAFHAGNDQSFMDWLPRQFESQSEIVNENLAEYLERAQDSWESFNAQVRSGWSQTISAMITGTKDFQSAVLSMVSVVENAIANRIAEKFTDTLFSAIESRVGW